VAPCVQTNALQVIGVDPNFDFDVAAADPLWMNANEDGILSVRSRRRQSDDEILAQRSIQNIHRMEEMGLIHRFGRDICVAMLERHEQDFDRALDGIMAYSLY